MLELTDCKGNFHRFNVGTTIYDRAKSPKHGLGVIVNTVYYAEFTKLIVIFMDGCCEVYSFDEDETEFPNVHFCGVMELDFVNRLYSAYTQYYQKMKDFREELRVALG